MGAPKPLPGTDMCGSTMNPYFVVRLREPPNPYGRNAQDNEEKERELDDAMQNHDFNVQEAKERVANCERLKAQLVTSKHHLEMMKVVAATREESNNTMGDGRDGKKKGSGRKGSPLRLSPCKTPTADQLRSVVSQQSPLHALMLGRFSPLKMKVRATML